MNICRVFSDKQTRDMNDVSELGRFATSIISDCQMRFGGPVGIGLVGGLSAGERVAGTAFTVRTRPGDNLVVHQALTMIRPGHVLVVDAGGAVDRSILGEIMARQAKASGVAAIVVDGAVRDAAELAALKLPVFAAGVTHVGPYRTGPGELRGAVSIGGTVVRHGDAVVGDSDGVVIVRREDIADIAYRCAQRDDMEREMLSNASQAALDYKWLDEAIVLDICREMTS